jgi:pyruvate/2-oxoglutarate dehydrogenase complex dihydrolipoamide dehydrogenase (E3) component
MDHVIGHSDADQRGAASPSWDDVQTDTLVEALSPDGGGIRVDYRSGPAADHLIADAVFFAVGWPANIGHLALEAAGVQATPAAIGVDDTCSAPSPTAAPTASAS